jgi:membrane associated rhomboid family serine protease
MLPLKDNIPTRTFPFVTVAIIVANALVWILWEHAGSGHAFQSAVIDGSYRPCEVVGDCRQIGQGWVPNVFTSMFMHGSWEHIIGNMLFLWIFGNNVEDTVGKVRFVAFYFLAGIAATGLQTFVTLSFAPTRDAGIPNLGASGAIAGVLGAYILLYPGGRVLTLLLPFFIFELPAFLYLGIWFLFQLITGGSSFTHPEAGGGVAYFAHIGGFIFGLLTVKLFSAGRPPKVPAPRWA